MHADTLAEPTTVPLGLTSFVGDFWLVRRIVDRHHENVVSWRGHTVGGSRAAHQSPDALLANLLGAPNTV